MSLSLQEIYSAIGPQRQQILYRRFGSYPGMGVRLVVARSANLEFVADRKTRVIFHQTSSTTILFFIYSAGELISCSISSDLFQFERVSEKGLQYPKSYKKISRFEDRMKVEWFG